MKVIRFIAIFLFIWPFQVFGQSESELRPDELGPYKALIIGIDKYRDNSLNLESARNDAEAMAKLLCEKYGFQDVELYLDHTATKRAIYEALRELVRTCKENDSLLIYYSGHGEMDRITEKKNDGWWLPTDAVRNETFTYLENGRVRNQIDKIKARHILIISDSCYAGTILTRDLSSQIGKWYHRQLYSEKSRWGMTSGDKHPVSDQGPGNHSIFAFHLLNALKKNKHSISALEIFNQIVPKITRKYSQKPVCKPLEGDGGGQFIFVRSDKTAETATYKSSCPRVYDMGNADTAPAEASMESKINKKGFNTIGMKFNKIMPGKFKIGSRARTPYADDDESQHKVELTKWFWIQTTEVTQEQWEDVTGKNPSFNKQCRQCPVEQVSWNEVNEFIKALNHLENTKGYRLPTEAEWEYACRAGTDMSFPISKDGKCLSTKLANYNGEFTFPDCDKGKPSAGTRRVGSFPAGGGLYDMHGNVWEWCQDVYDEDAYTNIESPDPKYLGNDSSNNRVIRGGAWTTDARSCRCTHRAWEDQNRKSYGIGFRLVRDLDSY